MAYPFTEIIILYNPNSTGPSEDNAKGLKEDLTGKLPKSVSLKVKATKRPGHAEEIGAEYAKQDSRALLVSSSGDGGYNELINGVLQHDTKHVAVAVLPSGNANDHHHATADDDLIDRIVAGKTTLMDVLEVTATKDGQPWTRYAHSYVGIGLTAYIGEKLTEAELNPINEKWLVAKYLLKFGHVTLKLDDAKQWRHYCSVVIANIDRMSKRVQLSNSASMTDGKAEVYVLRSRSVWGILKYLIRGATAGLTPWKRTKELCIDMKHDYEIQLDGEIALDQKVKVTVRAQSRKLLTVA